MPANPTRTLFIYDKPAKNGYILLDSDDSTPLYTVTLNEHRRPHLTVHRATNNKHNNNDPEPDLVGTASFTPYKKGRFFFATSRIRTEFTLGARTIPVVEEKGGPFSAGKRAFDGVILKRAATTGRLKWKVGVTTTAFLRLVDSGGSTLATYRSEVHTLKRVGRFDVFVDGAEEEDGAQGWLDEIVVSGMAVVMEQKLLWRVHVGWGDA